MTGMELMAKVIARLLDKEGYDVEWEGDIVYIMRRTNPEYFKVKVTVEKEEVEDERSEKYRGLEEISLF